MTTLESQSLQGLWDAVDGILGRAPLAGVLAHKLGPLAAHRLRRIGEPIPEPLVNEERASSLSLLTGIPLLVRARQSCDGPLVLLKGMEVARRYRGGARRFGDLDLLTDDAELAQRTLLRQGFLEIDDPTVTDRHHHLLPLKWPTIIIAIEIHSHASATERSLRSSPRSCAAWR